MLKGRQVLVTGVGMKPVGRIFTDITTGQPSHTPILSNGTEYKANLGAAIAFECAAAGARVHIVSRTDEKLQIVKSWILESFPNADVQIHCKDLNTSEGRSELVDEIPSDLPLYWVQSAGLGAGTVALKGDNPYLPIDQISPELIEAELSVPTSTIALLQALLPRFRTQNETRVAVISSMSAVRSFANGSAHMMAKGAISRFVNAATIELAPEGIYLTDVRPGGVDTGLYDSKEVQDTVTEVSRQFGYDWSEANGGPRLMPASAAAKAVVMAMKVEAHITSINLVARGQFPHEGS